MATLSGGGCLHQVDYLMRGPCTPKRNLVRRVRYMNTLSHFLLKTSSSTDRRLFCLVTWRLRWSSQRVYAARVPLICTKLEPGNLETGPVSGLQSTNLSPRYTITRCVQLDRTTRLLKQLRDVGSQRGDGLRVLLLVQVP